MERLRSSEIKQLAKELSSWRLVGKKTKRLVKTFRFEGFLPGVELVNEVAKVAEDMNHHPDISMGYGYVRFSLMTHDAKGLTRRDFELGKKIDEIARAKGLS